MDARPPAIPNHIIRPVSRRAYKNRRNDTPNKHIYIYNSSLLWLGTCTSLKVFITNWIIYFFKNDKTLLIKLQTLADGTLQIMRIKCYRMWISSKHECFIYVHPLYMFCPSWLDRFKMYQVEVNYNLVLQNVNIII